MTGKVETSNQIVYPLQPYTLTLTLQTHHIHPHTCTPSVSPISSFQESLTLQDIPQLPKSGEERRGASVSGRSIRSTGVSLVIGEESSSEEEEGDEDGTSTGRE